MLNLNEKAFDNFLFVLSEAGMSGDLYAHLSPEWIILNEIDEKAFEFRLNIKDILNLTFVAYKKNNPDEYYLHSYTAKGFSLTKEEFQNYFTMLNGVGHVEIVNTHNHGKKPKKSYVKKATFGLENKLHKRLKNFAINTESTMVEVVEKALIEYMDNHSK